MTSAYLDCNCPPEVRGTDFHVDTCPLKNIDEQIVCAPGSSCCKVDHDHGAAANACATDHSAHECVTPKGCPVHQGQNADAHRALAEAGEPVPDCPGGHCALGVQGCAVCRPLIITVMPGSMVTLAGNGG